MQINSELEWVINYLCERRLGDALTSMEAYMSSRPQYSGKDRLFAIRSDFQLMSDYWKRGYRDPQLPALYQTLLQRLYVLWAEACKAYHIGHSAYLSSVYMHVQMIAHDWSPQTVREEMETFVSEVAMLDFEPEHKREEKRKELYRQHQYQMNLLFDYVLTSATWTDGQALGMEEILLSPTIDTNDQQLLISSIMISTMEIFDIAKFRTLVRVYQSAVDERVRQRALVGWVMARHSPFSVIYPEQTSIVEHLLEDERCCRELVDLQKQIIYCINAERDHQTIQQEIMPDLLKNQNFRVTRNGIEEVEEDQMADILHPDEQERKLEQMEESFQRMVEMQRQGSDIYFGGFSQMKRFPFFSDMCNWFVPFYFDHPTIAGVVSQQRTNRFLLSIVEKGPFCNSDKYSFVFAFQQVIERIPQNLREMLERGEAKMSEMTTEEMENAAYIRRTYLQDLYRFYRLFPRRQEFSNPFDDERAVYLFCANSLFSCTHLEPYFNEVVAFLLKQGRLGDANRVLHNYGDARRDFQYWVMAGYMVHHMSLEEEEHCDFDEEVCYANGVALQPDSERALQGYARVLFARGKYEEALQNYEKLLAINPDKKSHRLNYAACLTNLGRYETAQKELFRLNYEYPEDQNVTRVLAWTLACDGKYDRAEKIYNQLLSQKTVLPDDLLNYGYCLWFSGHVDDAIDCFHRFIKECSWANPDYIIENERSLLIAKGITEPEMQMMVWLL